jgi:glycerophosphoryl diester phosphodiesterase
VNDRDQAERLLVAGVSAVFTDRPDLWRRDEM